MKDDPKIQHPIVRRSPDSESSISLPRKVLAHVFVYTPKPLNEPKVEDGLFEMPVPQRVIECARYGLARFEYALAPNGWLRGWILFTLRWVLFIIILLLGILAVVTALVPIFGGIAEIFRSIELASGSLLRTVVNLVMTVAIVAACIAGLVVLKGVLRK